MENLYGNEKEELLGLIKEAKEVISILDGLAENGEITKTLFEQLKKDIEGNYIGIKKTKGLQTKLSNQLEADKKLLEEYLKQEKKLKKEYAFIITELKSINTKAKSRFESIEKYNQYIKDKKKEVTLKKEQSQKLLKQTQELNKKVSRYLKNIISDKVEAKKIVKDIEAYAQGAEKNYKELNNYLQNGKKKFDTIDKNERKSNQFLRQTESKVEKIKKWYENLFSDKGLKQKLIALENTMISHQDKIDDQLNQAASNRLCGAFLKKVESLESNLIHWKQVILWSTIIAVVLSIGIPLMPLLKENLEISAWQQLEIISPILFIIIFSTFQYINTKKYLEEYDFKYVASFSLPAYYELIDDKNEEKGIDFLINNINEIYSHPSEKISKLKGKDHIYDYVVDAIKGCFGNKGVDCERILMDILKNNTPKGYGCDKESTDSDRNQD